VLTEFQRFHTVTEEKASSIVKMFLIQFINTVRTTYAFINNL
jgi:hypothetical protein